MCVYYLLSLVVGGVVFKGERRGGGAGCDRIICCRWLWVASCFTVSVEVGVRGVMVICPCGGRGWGRG